MFVRMRKHLRRQTRESGFLNEQRNFSETEDVYMSSTTRGRRVTFGVRRVYRRNYI